MGKARYAWITMMPMAWLVIVTQTAGWQKMFHSDPRIGFLAEADRLAGLIVAGKVPAERIAATEQLVFNNRLDAVVTGVFASLVLVILADSAREWYSIVSRRKAPILREAEYVVSALAD